MCVVGWEHNYLKVVLWKFQIIYSSFVNSLMYFTIIIQSGWDKSSLWKHHLCFSQFGSLPSHWWKHMLHWYGLIMLLVHLFFPREVRHVFFIQLNPERELLCYIRLSDTTFTNFYLVLKRLPSDGHYGCGFTTSWNFFHLCTSAVCLLWWCFNFLFEGEILLCGDCQEGIFYRRDSAG